MEGGWAQRRSEETRLFGSYMTRVGRSTQGHQRLPNLLCPVPTLVPRQTPGRSRRRMRGVAESQQTRCGSQTQLTSSIFHRPTLATKKGPEAGGGTATSLCSRVSQKPHFTPAILSALRLSEHRSEDPGTEPTPWATSGSASRGASVESHAGHT